MTNLSPATECLHSVPLTSFCDSCGHISASDIDEQSLYQDWQVYREESKACGFEYISFEEYKA